MFATKGTNLVQARDKLNKECLFPIFITIYRSSNDNIIGNVHFCEAKKSPKGNKGLCLNPFPIHEGMILEK